MENTGFKNAFEYKVIYVWTAANNPAYNGYVKVGCYSKDRAIY